MSEKQNVGVHVATWASWRALIKALRGNALATFPPEAFEADVVVHRFLDMTDIEWQPLPPLWPAPAVGRMSGI